MKAVLLAAGRGRRMGIDGPKCLLEIAGQTLLERHIDNAAPAGISEVIVVTGHGHDEVLATLERIAEPAVKVTTVYNERYLHGSLVSLACAFEELVPAGGLWMDADVIYPSELLARLVQSTRENCVLLDARSSEQGEEMMLAVSKDRVRRIARRVGEGWDLVGESVGFFKIGPSGARLMQRVLSSEVAAGRLDQEHEDALDVALAEVPFGYERADDLPWTEIDFPEDVLRATRLVELIDPARAVVAS
ncbi:MAG TPA: phosphocholine cytidylyltransferase family protein [Polyangiaceae bacterium]|nr:phosphocholine cytidylyltransferase family protein [Polyangiaceae bacterium]